ncbi:hypothetical protein ARMA_2705 [Ardenticatena maritima]|uniref:Putative nickel insertion protein n=1 Tax=Ardenticatena maritima TaxID=872965 RepID=A0A0M8KAW3_9CHLR|nr:nickel pincer cofactor biosynthesis protein LarC [Ardenticatena maritima]KPL89674.1 hypothetical protein SE16_04560 [Ardenticatena maritima]GAP64282.1 hypothetical protein ARMA_2705 [Ardenticatena maritima]
MLAYIDAQAGVSGDMLLGALVDVGWPLDALRTTVERLHLPREKWRVWAESVQRGALRATLVHVETDEEHHHRHLPDIRAMIEAADLPEAVKQGAIGVFTRLAEAEAHVHGIAVEKVHFHEVGALDAIIDIVGVVAGFHALGITQVYASPVPLAHGWANTAHGRIPLPAPATLELLAAVNAPTRPAPGEGELVTPTGAALLAHLARFEQPPMRIQRVGYGAGQKTFPWPNVVRLWLGASDDEGPLRLLETNIDDMNPELFGTLPERLLAAGALDVWFTPVQMKKGRPGVVVQVLARAADEARLATLLLRETTTLGVRVHDVRRYEAARDFQTVQTPYGAVRVKRKHLNGRTVGAMPEFEECRRLAEAHNVPVRDVYEAAFAAAQHLVEREA